MHDLIIIGAGPAGLTAALYAGRYRLNTLVLEKAGIGGQIILSDTIENFPGFPGGIPTQELIERIKKQIEGLGINIETEEAMEVSSGEVKTKNKAYSTKSIIIASGARPKKIGVEGEERLTGRGVSYCGTCDGPLFKDKEIVVVGAGDRALEEVLFLAGFANKVMLVHRRDQLRASKILQEKAQKNPKINFILNSIIEEIIGRDKVEKVLLKNTKTNSTSDVICQGVFIFAGIKPNTNFIKGQLQLDESGFVITDEDLRTSQEGIFACGDCRKKSLYQVITACAEGALSAYSAQRYLL